MRGGVLGCSLMLWCLPTRVVAAAQDLSQVALSKDALAHALESHLLMGTVLAALTIITGALIANILWRHRIEEALRLGEERFRAAFESAAHGMTLVGTDGVFQKVNPALCAFLGYDEEALVGMAFDRITHPDDVHLSHACIQRFLAGDTRPCHFEKRYVHRDGHVLWAFLSTTLVKDRLGRPLYFVSQIQDISERKKAEMELDATRRRLENIIEFLPDATFAIDAAGKVVAWNRAMEELSGVCSDAVLDRVDFEYSRILIGTRTPILIDHVLKPVPAFEAEYAALEKRGDTFYAERYLPNLHCGRGGYFWIKASPLYDCDGRVIGAIESLRDITERREAEENLRQANRELDAFVYTVSHDLRAPLTPILGYAQYLQSEYREVLDDEALKLLGRIEQQSVRMVARMETLLALAKLGYLDRPESPTDVNQVLVAVRETLACRMIAAGIALQIQPLPPIHVPEPLLSQVFENLIGNAVQYAGAAKRPITVGGGRYAAGVRYFVRDHGPGIPAEDRELVFDTFYRGDSGRKSAGTGVGLAIVKKITRLYGGHVWVDETPGGGSTFWVELPDSPVAHRAVEDQAGCGSTACQAVGSC